MERRKFLLASCATVGATIINTALHAEDVGEIELISQMPPLPDDLEKDADQLPAPYTPTEVIGTGKPKQDEIDAAYKILLASPYDAHPIEIAQYFLAIGSGAYGNELRKYAREWPVRANPVMYHFFSSTQTKPEGDVTAWCAAFVNWCLLRSQAKSKDEIGEAPGSFSITGKAFPSDHLKKFSTNSASSGSFRCWKEITSPNRGDIVVFKDKGTDSMTPKCLGTGHVAFFLAVPKTGWVQVLGGNQSFGGSNGAVTVSNMRTDSGSRFMKYVGLKGA